MNKNLLSSFSDKALLILASIFLIIFFFYGFFTLENSAGAGGYNGDLKKIWNNLELFKSGILSNIDSVEYDDSRTPLSYLIHLSINPFISTIEEFRMSVFFISLFIPILFFYCLKIKFSEIDSFLIIFISLLITLSPYFRTTSFWGLGENYGLISVLVSYLVYEKYKSLRFGSDKFSKYIIIFLLVLFSSSSIYFDQKLLIFPLIFYLYLMISKIPIKDKVFINILYFIFSLPFLLLVFKWGSILPPAAEFRMLGKKIEIYNLGYCSSIIAFYLFPFIFFKKLNFSDLKKKLINEKIFFPLIFIFFYFILIYFLGDFQNLPKLGKGVLDKFLILTIDNYNLRLFITLIGFLISFLIIYTYIDNYHDGGLVLYFLLISLFIHPFLQEYIDPIFLIIIFLYFKSKIFISKNGLFFISSYFLIFLIIAQIFYDSA